MAEIRRIVTGSPPVYYEFTPAAGRILAGYYDPKLQQPQIVSLNAAADPASRRVVLDPNAMDPSGHTTVDWWSVSPNGQLLAVPVSKNGSEDGSLHVFRIADGTEVEAVIPRVQYPTAGGSVAWTPEARRFDILAIPDRMRLPPISTTTRRSTSTGWAAIGLPIPWR